MSDSPRKIRWGILSTAKIARKQVIPAINKSHFGEVTAIASRNPQKAEEVAKELSVPAWYGSYEELLASPDVDAIYNPLPNHMHIPWTLKAMKAGKHVLCEKPVGMNAREADHLLQHSLKHPEIKVMEAFMYRFHPQWQLLKNLVDEGKIGQVVSVNAVFTYYKDDPDNIRNDPEMGGGGLMDIGCYCISFARWITGREPHRVSAFMTTHPQHKVDMLSTAILDFGNGTHASFQCSTLAHPVQYIQVIGTSGRIYLDLPVNVPEDQNCTFYLEAEGRKETILIDMANQYTLQADYFARAILDQSDVPTPLSDAVANMRVIDALMKSAETGSVEHIHS